MSGSDVSTVRGVTMGHVQFVCLECGEKMGWRKSEQREVAHPLECECVVCKGSFRRSDILAVGVDRVAVA